MTTSESIPTSSYRRLARLFHLVRIDRRHDPAALIRAHRAAAAALGRHGAEADTPAYRHARERLLHRAVRSRGPRGRTREVQVRGLGGGPEDFTLLATLTRCSARRRAAYALALLEGMDDTGAAACLERAKAADRDNGERADAAAIVAAVAAETGFDAEGQRRVLGHPMFDPTVARVAALPRRRGARRIALAVAGAAIAGAVLLVATGGLPPAADLGAPGSGFDFTPAYTAAEALRSWADGWLDGLGPALFR